MASSAARALLRHSARAVPSPSHAGRRGSKHLDWFINAVARGEAAKAAAPTSVMPADPLHGRKRARAFLDFSFGRPAAPAAASPAGADVAAAAAAPPPPVVSRVVVELADDIVPRTVTNFLQVRSCGACDRGGGGGERCAPARPLARVFMGTPFSDLLPCARHCDCCVTCG
jgi:hypothetical protein